MSKARDIANILSGSTSMATDAEVTSAISGHAIASNGHVSRGNTASRPATPSNGDMYANTQTGFLEVYNTTYGWEQVGAAASTVTGVTATDSPSGRAYNNGAASISFTPGNVTARTYTVTSSPGSYTASGSSSPITITGLQSSTQYTYTIIASNNYGTSSASSASSAVTATTVPQAPSISSVTGGNAQAVVAFSANATGGSSITGYTITSNPGSITATGSSSPITITGLTNGTPYTFTAVATNTNGSSSSSSSSSSITPAAGLSNIIGTLNISSPYNGGWVTSSGTNALLYNVNGPNSKQSIVYLTDNAITWQKEISVANPSYTGGAVLSPNGNIVVASDSSSQTYGQLNIFNASGSNTLQKLYTTGSGTIFSSAITDSSNNIYVNGCSDASQQALLAKIDTSGNILWNRKWSCVTYSGGFQVGHLDGSGNFYGAGYVHGGYQGIVAKVDSSGAAQWYANIRGNSSPTSGEGNFGGLAVSNGGDVYAGGGWSSSGGSNRKPTLFKYSTNGALQWQREFAYGTAANTYYSGVVYDNNNSFIYGVFGNYIVKYNTSGTLQWQRKFTTATVSLNTIALNGSNLVIGGNIDSKPAIIIVPTDGSKTGSYTIGASTVVYEAGTGTEQSGNALTTDAGLTSGTASLSVSTPSYSIADTSYVLTKVNI